AVVSGAAVAVFAVLAFGTVHAWLIVPIWSRLLGGLPLAAAAGIALSWAYDTVAARRTITEGAQFGAVMFATLLPSAALDAVLRLNGLRLHETLAAGAADICLYVISGAIAG